MIIKRNILILGRTGSGKSTLANVMTRTNLFKEGEYGVSQTKKYQKETCNVDGMGFTVVDTIGIGDTKLEGKVVLSNITEAAHSVTEGYHQIVYVTSGKFTEEEVEVFNILLSAVFNQNVNSFVTIVKTRFPSFRVAEKCNEDIAKLKAENSTLHNIISHCNKILHINNLTAEEEPSLKARNDSQLKLLIHLRGCDKICQPKPLLQLRTLATTFKTEKEKLNEQLALQQKKLLEQKQLQIKLEADRKLQLQKQEEERKRLAALAVRQGPCFAPGTKIYTNSRSEFVDIEQLVQGYELSTLDLETGDISLSSLDQIQIHEPKYDIISMQLSNGEVIDLTSDHYLLVDELGWVRARDLRIGEKLMTYTSLQHSERNPVLVQSLSSGKKYPLVYNLVTKEKTYFVGKSRLCAHSCDSVPSTIPLQLRISIELENIETPPFSKLLLNLHSGRQIVGSLDNMVILLDQVNTSIELVDMQRGNTLLKSLLNKNEMPYMAIFKPDNNFLFVSYFSGEIDTYLLSQTNQQYSLTYHKSLKIASGNGLCNIGCYTFNNMSYLLCCHVCWNDINLNPRSCGNSTNSKLYYLDLSLLNESEYIQHYVDSSLGNAYAIIQGGDRLFLMASGDKSKSSHALQEIIYNPLHYPQISLSPTPINLPNTCTTDDSANVFMGGLDYRSLFIRDNCLALLTPSSDCIFIIDLTFSAVTKVLRISKSGSITEIDRHNIPVEIPTLSLTYIHSHNNNVWIVDQKNKKTMKIIL